MMKYPLHDGQTVEYMVLHALEQGMQDSWAIRKHLLLRGANYMLTRRQISGALQRLKKNKIVTINKTTGVQWLLAPRHPDGMTDADDTRFNRAWDAGHNV
jgi:hypothetical protein